MPHQVGQAMANLVVENGSMESERKLKVERRAKRWTSKRSLEFDVVEQICQGFPPQKVEVTKHGKIDGACDGKLVWDAKMWGQAPHLLQP